VRFEELKSHKTVPLISLIDRGDVNGDGTENDRVLLRGAALRCRVQRHLIAILTEQLITLAVNVVGLEKQHFVVWLHGMANHARRETPTGVSATPHLIVPPFQIRFDRRADHLALHSLHLHRGPAVTMNPAVPRTEIREWGWVTLRITGRKHFTALRLRERERKEIYATVYIKYRLRLPIARCVQQGSALERERKS